MMAFAADYVDVAERIQAFYAAYPDGRLSRADRPYTVEVGDTTFIVYTALAYRFADDPVPGVGTAWERVPGKTSFTKDSELMNAETSAWGRAIIAVGFAAKGSPIASANEVLARTGHQISDKQRDELRALVKACGWGDPELRAALKQVGVKNVTNVRTALAGLNESQASDLAALMKEAAGPILPANATPLKS